jgi:hypothetical protein
MFRLVSRATIRQCKIQKGKPSHTPLEIFLFRAKFYITVGVLGPETRLNTEIEIEKKWL